MADKRTASERRADYYRMALRYKKNRSENQAEVKRLKKIIKRQTVKIGIWERAMRRIDARRQKLNFINSLIKDKYNFSMFCSGKQDVSDKKKMVQKMFCKYMIEMGIEGVEVSEFVGWSNRDMASKLRRQLSKSFQADESALEQWKKFKSFLNNKTIKNEQDQTIKQ